MKRTIHPSIVPLLLVFAFAACATEAPEVADPNATYEAFGASVAAEGAVPVQAVVAEPSVYVGRTVRIEGIVREVCQVKGCWLTLDAGDGTPVRVNVAKTEAGDYAFTVPKDIDGRRVVVEGWLEEATLTAEEQQHLAEDAGTAYDSLAAPAGTELRLTAAGVLVEKVRT